MFFLLFPGKALPAEASEISKPAPGAKRPKICLVLSGGGARGAAHIGVIKVLEEYRVPVDCIAGTSMGSLVGAAYATGTTIAEIEKINAAISIELLFKESPPRQELSMRRKEDDYNIFFGPEFGSRGKDLLFGKGVVTGVQLETVLRQLSKTKGYQRFDELPIPFRAVATDLVTGKAVVFKEGELANVMRASMSVPGAVAPAEVHGMLLVDGMLTSNLPVETARSMGADVIIAVNVGTPLLKRDQLNGILGITSQMLSILTEQNVQASIALLKPGDVLITPELSDYSTGDFNSLPEIAPLGETAARKVADRLAQLSLPPDEYAALRRRQTVTVAPDLRPVDEIRFENLHRVNPQTALAVMETKPGQPVDQKTLDGDMRRLYGTGDFEHVNYRYVDEPEKRVLSVEAVEKEWGPDYLRFGLGLSSDFRTDAYFNVLASYRKTWLNSLGAEWRTDLQIGRTRRLQTEFYQPLNVQGSLFVAPLLALERSAIDVYQDDDRLARYDVFTRLAGVAVGAQFRQYGQLKLGVVRGTLKPILDTGPQSLSPGSPHIAAGGYTARLLLDQLDSVYFPRKGWYLAANVFDSNTHVGADQEYTKWDTDGSAVYSVGEHTFNVGVKFAGKIGSNPLPRYDQFQWGGFLAQSGYATGQFIGEKIEYGRLMYYRRILRGTIFEGLYGGVSLEAGKIGNPLVPGNPDGLLKSIGLFVGMGTLLGPMYFGFGHTADANNSLYFYLGRPF